MIIERNLSAYLVYAEDPVLRALEKITANQARIIFLVDSHGHLEGSLSDGDFRRWVATQDPVDLNRPALEAAHAQVRSAPVSTTPSEIATLFGAGIDHVPLVDERGRLVAVAINRDNEVRIGRFQVDKDSPALVISEIGINHQGSVDFAKELVDRSVDAGADVVKFQLRDMAALYRQGSGGSGGEDLGPQYTLDLLAKFNLTSDQLFQVFDHCADVGIEVMCTAWDPPSVDRLAEYGIPGFKVASADMTNHSLLRHMAQYGVPMVISTGMSTEAEIMETVELVRGTGASYALLHCQSTYPAPFKDVNLRYLERLAEIGQCPVGYSGHERGFHVPLAAVALGAKIIEKHFTTDRSLEGNDHKVSLLPGEFKEMVQRIRELEEALGNATPRGVSTGEMMNRVNLAKSLVAVRRIEVGDTIVRDLVDIKSPGRGLQPNALERLVGRTAMRAFDPGDFFYASDLGDAAPHGRQYDFKRPWGLPVRYHDIDTMTRDCIPDFLEFHFSYKDLEIEPAAVFEAYDGRLDTAYACHSPDLFAGDFILNLASEDDAHWERSIAELQQVIELTRSLRPYFRSDAPDPVVIASLGGLHQGRARARARARRHVRPGGRGPRPDRRLRRPPVRADPAAVPLVHGRPAVLQPLRRGRRHRRVGRALRPPAVPGRVALQAGRELQGPAVLRGHRPPRAVRRPPAPRGRHRRRRRRRPGRRRRDRLGAAGPSARRAGAGRRVHPRDLAGPRQRRRGLLDRPGAPGAVVLTAGVPTAVWAIPVSALGGVARHVLDTVRAGIPGWRLVVLCPPGPLVDEVRSAGGAVTAVPFGPDHGFVTSARSLRGTVDRLRPAVVHSHLSYADIVSAAATPRSVALVTTEHGIAADDSVYHGSAAKSALMARVHRTRLRRFDAVVAVSEATRRAMAAKWHPRQEVRVILNGVDPLPEPPAPRPGLRILSLARLSPEKRFADLVAAFALVARDHDEATLTLAGVGELEADLLRQVRALGLDDRVTLPGYVDAAGALAKADVLAMLSVWENCPYAVLDGLVHGTGVVAAAVGGMPEMLPEHCLVDPADHAATAALLVEQGRATDARPKIPAGWPTVADMAASIGEVYAGARR